MSDFATFLSPANAENSQWLFGLFWVILDDPIKRKLLISPPKKKQFNRRVQVTKKIFVNYKMTSGCLRDASEMPPRCL